MKLNVPKGHKLFATWDHVKPKSLGGSGSQDNLMLAHQECNSLRSNYESVKVIWRPDLEGTE